ncbi:MAG: Mu transposase C-terminal domain-containing protein [Nocardioidaceae bacterium]|nr:Mu transposase C-terminal domain-containing protein [Nocardioidaceae bacterium]
MSALLGFRDTHSGVVPSHVYQQYAAFTGVGERTLRRWVANAIPLLDVAKKERVPVGSLLVKGRESFTITEEHLVAIRSHLNLTKAHEDLFPPERKGEPGWVSYPTFARAFKAVPASIREGILNGWDAMSKHGVYLSMTAPHRNHTWHLDHTEVDAWVHLGRSQILRPWASIVRDGATGMKLAAVAYQGRPNEDSICDLLATAARMRTYKTRDGQRVEVGGLPVQLVLDNAHEHFAEAVMRGAMMLGVVFNPTKAYYKHQNGPAESTFSKLNEQLLKGMPGYTKGGVADDGQPLIAKKYAHEVDPADVMQMETFQKALDTWVTKGNETGTMHRLGDQTPVEAWANDPTPIRRTPPETTRAMMLRASKGHAINTEGIRFRRVNYVAPELNYYRDKGLRVEVRYLKREERFIEVFYEGQWVCTATDRELLTPAQKQALLENRERDLALVKRINHAANQDRKHRHLAGENSAYDENDDTDTTEGYESVDETVASVTNLDTRRPAANPEPPVHERQDPTTPTQRKKRSPAPAQKEAASRRTAKKEDKQYERIARRPGSNFGEEGEDQ